METHVKVVAILSIIFGVMMALGGLIVFGVLAGAGAVSGDMEAAWISGTVGTVIGGLLVILSLPSLIGGIGLLKYRNWARVLIIIVAALSLLNIPFGTAYGIYALWALLSVEAKPLFV